MFVLPERHPQRRHHVGLHPTGRTLGKGLQCISLQDERHRGDCLSRVDGDAQLSKAPFDRTRRFKFLQSECRIFLHESMGQANRADNSPFQWGTFQLHQTSPNGTMALSFISALPIGKCGWNLSSIYHFPQSNSVLFYVDIYEETELQHNLDKNLTS